jgi:drug/metabolite transporter (DMT)-like permease
LDVAVVLSSLYPASTVILARLVLDEQVSRTQWVGVGFCVVAISLIAI